MPTTNFEGYSIQLRQKCSNCILGKVKNPVRQAQNESGLAWDAFQNFIGADLGDMNQYKRLDCPKCKGRSYFETWVNMDEFIASIAQDVAKVLEQDDILRRVFGDKEDTS